MKNIFKPLEVLATNSKATNFNEAVIRLTAYYTAGVFLILIVFSFLVYGLFSAGVGEQITEDRAELYEAGEETEDADEFFHEVTENLLNILLLSDAVLLLVTVLVSYILARKTLAPLAIAYQRQQRFVADVAHELRTPLAVMKAGSEVLLQHDRTQEQYKKFTAESQEEVDRLITLSNDLLFLIQNNAVGKESFEKFSLSQVCETQSKNVVPYAELSSITLDSHIEKNVIVRGKKDDIARLLLNILKNAIDYNKPQGKVVVTLVKKQRQAILTVEDTGIGIAPHNLAHIFDRFYKADSSRTQKHTAGSGLGLSIAQEIATRHGGTIDVKSILGEGSTFVLSFPCE